MQELNIYILSGAGNIFGFLDRRAEDYFDSFSSRKKWVQEICNGAYGFTLDGFVFIENKNKIKKLKYLMNDESELSEIDFCWDFYNKDGSSAEMCGNASRCVVSLIQKLSEERIPKTIKFLTRAGLIEGEIRDGVPYVQMTPWRVIDKILLIPCEREFSAATLALLVIPPKEIEHGVGISGVFVDTGVPHFVIEVRNLNQELLFSVAKVLRNHKYFATHGTNVTFYKKINTSELQAMTFERGVENFTLACGTGAVAAAVCLANNYEERIRVELPGGDVIVLLNHKSQLPTLLGKVEWHELGRVNNVAKK